MANTAITPVEGAVTALDRHRPMLTGDELEVLRATVLAGASDAQLNFFALSCNRRGYDPFSKEVYGFVNRDGGIELVVSIEGLRKKAGESGEYRGQTGQQWCGPDGVWQEVWLHNQPPMAARITVHRQGCEPFTGIALWREFGKPNGQNWKQYPTVMLSKCAEANAIRHLFPNQTHGLLIAEEVADRAVEASHRVANERTGRATGQQESAPRRTIAEPQNGGEAAKEHEEGWRLRAWEKVQELGLSARQINDLRRELDLPLLERMTVQQSKAIYERLLNWDPLPDDAAVASGGEPEQAGMPIDAQYVDRGEPGLDRHSA